MLQSGIYCPTLTFFKNDAVESLDLDLIVKHGLYLAKAGLKGLVLQGSTGEAVSLNREERKQVISALRQALDKEGYNTCTIIAGIGGDCLQASIGFAQDAKEAGAEYGIVLSPSYFSMLMSESALEAYFLKLADQSPIPFLVYNFPGVTNGINLSGPFLKKLSKHKKIVGTKLTCNTIAKMQYLSPDGPNINGEDFQVLTGSSEFLPSAVAAGICGPITGMSNMFPYTLGKSVTTLSKAFH